MLTILAVGGVALVLGYFYGPAAMQRRGLAEAALLRDKITPALKSDPRFQGIELHVSTSTALRVMGDVRDVTALEELRKMIVAPPGAHFTVHWYVNVRPASTAPTP
jgi:hypothetical protein